MPMFQIPLSNIPQKFAIDLVGKPYTLVNRWNAAAGGGWYIDIYDGDENPVVMNVPLVTGCDLFEQLHHLGLPGQAIVYTEGDEFAEPTYTNLGVESNLWLLT